jgi:transposase InsO family protein
VNGEWGYLATWMDVFSKVMVGWQVEEHMEASLVVGALKKSLQWRCPAPGLIIHSDQGGQYVSDQLVKLLKDYQCRQSMSRKGNCYDNAFAESFYGRFKTELLEGGAFLSIEDARTEIFDFIEIYYNRKRRHSSIDNKSPLAFEQQYYLSLNQ